MIERYSSPLMKSIWSDQNRFNIWLRIEILVCRSWAKLGKIPKKSLKNIELKANFDIEKINLLEKTVKHDVVAFIKTVSEYIGEDAKYLHIGLTSSDILDTCLSVQLLKSSDILILNCEAILETLECLANKYKNYVMIGRTHGIHAEPITFGLKMALWYEEMKRNHKRLLTARETIRVGKISGAVGTFANCPPEIESYVCYSLGLNPDPISNQIIQRDRIAEFMTTLAIIGASIEKFALEIRNLQRTEVGEVEEGFTAGQTGSSAMPHKKNPITPEKLCGLSRILRVNAIASLENVALWHERDISHSSVERIICPDSTSLLHHMLTKFNCLMKNLNVNNHKMVQNIGITNGLIFSQIVLLKLMELGMERMDAYLLVQRNAMRSINGHSNFKDLLKSDSDITTLLMPHEIDNMFTLSSLNAYHLKHLEDIYSRVFRK